MGQSICAAKVIIRGVPTSAITSSRYSSRSDSSAACSCSRQRLRRARFVDQSVSSKARRAASMARRMSSADASATCPSTSSVAGLMLSKRLPDAASTSSPSMSMRTSPFPAWLDMRRPLSDLRGSLRTSPRRRGYVSPARPVKAASVRRRTAGVGPVRDRRATSSRPGARALAARRAEIRRSCRFCVCPFDALSEWGESRLTERKSKGARSCDSSDTPLPTRPSSRPNCRHPSCTRRWVSSSKRRQRPASIVATGGIAPTSEGSIITLKDGEFSVLDGPFTEAKELVGGWALHRVPRPSRGRRVVQAVPQRARCG